MKYLAKLFPEVGELDALAEKCLSDTTLESRAKWLRHPCAKALVLSLYALRQGASDAIFSGEYDKEAMTVEIARLVGKGQCAEDLLGVLTDWSIPLDDDEEKEYERREGKPEG